MKNVEVMVPGDRAMFRFRARNMDVITSDFLEGVFYETRQSQKKLSKDVFKRFRRNRSRAYFRGKKKWVTLEVREGVGIREAREFTLRCRAMGK